MSAFTSDRNFTRGLGLYKPNLNEDAAETDWGERLNLNSDLIDDAITTLQRRADAQDATLGAVLQKLAFVMQQNEQLMQRLDELRQRISTPPPAPAAIAPPDGRAEIARVGAMLGLPPPEALTRQEVQQRRQLEAPETPEVYNVTTPNFGLNMPEVGGDSGIWGGLLNDNAMTLDGLFLNYLGLGGGTLSGQLTLPTTSSAGSPALSFGSSNGIYGQGASVAVSSFSTNVMTFSLSTNTSFAPLSMNNNRITNLATPTQPADAVNLSYVDGIVGNYLPLSGGQLSGMLVAALGSAAQPSLQLGSPDGTGFWRSGNFVVLNLQGQFAAAFTPGLTQFYSPVNMLNNKITQLGDATAAGDALNMRTADARYLAAQNASVVNVLDHGARGDGVTNDTTAMQNVLNVYAGRAVVFVPDTGQPYMTTGITLPSGTDLLLLGTIMLMPNSAAGVVTASLANNVAIRGTGTIDGNRAAQATHPGGMAGLAIDQCSHVRVSSGITLQNSYHWPLNVTRSDDVAVDGIYMLGGGSANEFAEGSSNCWLTNSLIDGTGNGDYNFCFYGGVTNSGAIGNVSRNAGAGTVGAGPGIGILSDTGQPAPCSNIVIANNICHDNGGPGIACLMPIAGGAGQSGIIITNNRCYNNCKIGYAIGNVADCFIDNSADVTISGNQFSANGNQTAGAEFYGVFLGPLASHVGILGNQIFNIGQNGGTACAALWNDGANHITMSGNYVYDDQTTPTMIYSAVGGAGTNNVYTSNFLGRPFELTAQPDTIVANFDQNGFAITGGRLIAGFAPVGYTNASGMPRWYAGNDGSTESGGNTGSNFVIDSVNDAGTPLLATPLTINRASGVVDFAQRPTVVGVPIGGIPEAPAGPPVFGRNSTSGWTPVLPVAGGTMAGTLNWASTDSPGANAIWLATGHRIGMDTAGGGGAANVQLSSDGNSLGLSSALTGAAETSAQTITSTAVGAGTNGPSTAQSGLTINHKKVGYEDFTAGVGEIDGVYVNLYQSGIDSDGSAFLAGITHNGQGFTSAHEYSVYMMQPNTWNVLGHISTTEAAMRNVSGFAGYGHTYTVLQGSMTTAILVQNTSPGAWNNVLQNQKNGVITFNLDDSGNVIQTGNLHIGAGSVAGTSRNIQLQTGTQTRWEIEASSDVESGGNNGSNFYISAFSDAGGFLSQPLRIYRNSGLITVQNGLMVSGDSGFNGTPPIAKPTVTGAWAGNTAGKALSVALAAYGLITDDTTA